MTDFDPNLYASLALAYIGGIRAPVDGQQGYWARVDSTGTNLEYVAQSIAQIVNAVDTFSTTKDSYVEIASTFTGTIVDAPFSVPASGCGVVYGGSTPVRIRVDVQLSASIATAAATVQLAIFVDGTITAVVGGSAILSPTDVRVLRASGIVEVGAGEQVDVRLVNLTNSNLASFLDASGTFQIL